MILLISPSERAQECATALQEATGEAAQACASLRQASILLRAQEYSAVALDQAFLDAEPDESEMLLQHMGAAIPVYVNFAISALPRVIRELRTALYRRKREVQAARLVAEQSLRNELKGNLTAMLLSCEMALDTPDLPPVAVNRLRSVYEQALQVRQKLGDETPVAS
ncbi:MAG: hypothetical protein JST79_04980 [Acidobacteria bacterium]|jgi:hypothetical protein|nr:hypothetical protein [Acidobacteriota bacterium]